MPQALSQISDYQSIQLSKEIDNMKIDPNKNTVVCGDNLNWLEAVPDESVDLCYIDPPFFSNRNYEIVWGNGAEVRSFGDRFSGGIEKYIDWMSERVSLIHQKLKPTGSIFLHCDWHASHRLRYMLDIIFGASNFRNEIIWCYKSGGATNNRFARKHDTIFFYSKTSNYQFIQQYEKSYRNESGSPIGKQKYFYDENGKYTMVVQKDYWELPILSVCCKERLGYPTQKPEKLISRIIKCATKEGDIVLDCFVGGGTTAKVCADLNRKFIVGDVSPVACRVTIERLRENCPKIFFEIKNLPTTEEDFKNMDGHKFEEMFCDLFGWTVNPKRKTDDGGIDGWDANKVPVQIKNHKKDIGSSDIRDFIGALVKNNKKEGKFVAWGFTKKAIESVAQVKNERGIVIELIYCATRLKDLIIDEVTKKEYDILYEQKIGKKDNQEDLEPAS